MNNQTVKQVGVRFAQLLRECIGDENLKKVITSNLQYAPDMCASHEFCDPNQIMLDAFEEITGRQYDDNYLTNEIFDRAWVYAKLSDFFFAETDPSNIVAITEGEQPVKPNPAEPTKADQLLKTCESAFNEIRNTRVWPAGETKQIDTYTIASRIGNYFRERGIK